jgi:hypothetical protein
MTPSVVRDRVSHGSCSALRGSRALDAERSQRGSDAVRNNLVCRKHWSNTG